MKERYERTDNGTVIDNRTGLEWQADHVGLMTWQEAMAYAGGLGDGWRLPSVEELITLIDYGRANPATNFPSHSVDILWSSSVLADDPSYAWIGYFSYGYVSYNVKNNYFHVRCVRRGPLSGKDPMVELDRR